MLGHIGGYAFSRCDFLEALFLPSPVKSIKYGAFCHCRSLRLLILPTAIDPSNVGNFIGAVIHRIGRATGLEFNIPLRLIRQHIDESPLHKLCYDIYFTTEKINNFLNSIESRYTLQKDTSYIMYPLHILAMISHASINAIAALLDSNIEAALTLDSEQKDPLNYASNFSGSMTLITDLCIHKNSLVSLEERKSAQEPRKNGKIEGRVK